MPTERRTSVVWDESRRSVSDKQAGANNLSFSTDDEFYKATRGSLPWAGPDSDGCGADPGRILLAATWVESLFRFAPCRSEAFKDSAQDPFKFLMRYLNLAVVR